MAGIDHLSVKNKTVNLTISNDTKEAKSCNTSNIIANINKTSCACNTSLPALTSNNYTTTAAAASSSSPTTTTKQKSQRPLTLCLTVIIMTLTLTMLPTYAKAAAIRKDLKKTEESDNAAEAQKAIERELVLLTSAEELIEEAMKDAINLKKRESSLDLKNSKDEAKDDDYDLDSLDVLKHMQLKEEHQMERQSKLRKRHLTHLDNLRFFDGSSHQVVWHNPCNVVRANGNFVQNPVPRRTFYYLRKFKEDIRKEYATRSLSLRHINIDDMESWRLHRDYYTFLPKLKQTSKISLSRWYRNMQTYVASFAYLGRTQFNWDMKKQRFVGETTKELDQLLTSARLILCELETAINGSHPDKNVDMLKSLSIDEMFDKLEFQTMEQERNGVSLLEPSILDLKFTKDFYLKYLASMRRILKRRLSNKNQDIRIESSELNGDDMEDDFEADTKSINVSSAMRTDSSMSMGESFEMIMRTQNQQRPRRNARRSVHRSAELPDM